MSGIILPNVDFSGSPNLSKRGEKSIEISKNLVTKNTHQTHSNKVNKSSDRNISKNKIITTEESTESEIDIDEIDSLIYKDGYPSSETETESDSISEEEFDLANKINDEPPVYDGEEPYYIFKRKWDAYLDNKITGTLHTHILSYMNSLFETEYTSLISIKKIEEKDIPLNRYAVDLIKEDTNYKKLFKIKYSLNVPTHKIIDRLLNTVNLSFVKINNKNGNYYCVKTGLVNRNYS